MPPRADIARNLDAVRRRIDAAAHRAHRPPNQIQLVAVSKTFSPDDVRAAAAFGQRAFGENRLQEALEKMDTLGDLPLEWHLLGHLQSNKAKRAAARFAWLESVDSLDLLGKIDAAAAESRVRPRVLIQVDLAHEATKHGTSEAEIRPLVDAAIESRALDLSGLMLVPPNPTHPEDSRPWFRQLRELRDRLVAAGVPADRLAQLSMGMSQDFEVAIEEGATIVRVGTGHFRRTTGDRAPGVIAIRATASGVRLDIRVVARGARVAVGEVRDGRLVIRVTAPPVNGAANDSAIAALSAAVDLPRRAFRIMSGETSRNKTIEVDGVTSEELRRRLQTATGARPTGRS